MSHHHSSSTHSVPKVRHASAVDVESNVKLHVLYDSIQQRLYAPTHMSHHHTHMSHHHTHMSHHHDSIQQRLYAPEKKEKRKKV